MFLSINNLNEGGCKDKNSAGKKRDLHEGENPKSANVNWSSSKNGSYVNSNWQKLRK